MKTKFKQASYRLRELEKLLRDARNGLLYDCSEEAVINEIKSSLRIWDNLDKNKLKTEVGIPPKPKVLGILPNFI